jgi:hypothetical protein
MAYDFAVSSHIKFVIFFYDPGSHNEVDALIKTGENCYTHHYRPTRFGGAKNTLGLFVQSTAKNLDRWWRFFFGEEFLFVYYASSYIVENSFASKSQSNRKQNSFGGFL